MTSKTPAAGAKSDLFAVAIDAYKTFYPNMDPEHLKSQAFLAAGLFQTILDSSSDREDCKQKTDAVTDALIKTTSPDTQALYRSANKKYTKLEKDICSDPEKELSDNEYTKLKEGFVASRREAQKEKNCLKCGKENDAVPDGKGGYKFAIKRCGKCKSAIYCSVVCQRADWERHKVECIKKMKAQDNQNFIFRKG